MILSLGIALVVLLIAMWLFTMYASYKIEQGQIPKKLSIEPVSSFVDKIERVARRGYYASIMYTKEGLSWSNKKVSEGFVKIIPSSAEAFAEKDELTGLKVGPLSFYLQSISESKTKSARRRADRPSYSELSHERSRTSKAGLGKALV